MDEAEAKLKIKKPEIVEEKTLKRPTPKGQEPKVVTILVFFKLEKSIKPKTFYFNCYIKFTDRMYRRKRHFKKI